MAVVLASLVMVIGCGGPREKRVVVLINGNSPYWDAVRAGMVAGEREFKLGDAGLKAVMEMNDGTAAGQISKLRQFASQSDIVAVAVSPLDANNQAVADAMRQLKERGVYVITLDGDLDRKRFRDARQFYLGTNNYAAGGQAGICARNLVPDGGDYVDFVGRTGAQNAIDRMDGVKAACGDKLHERDRMPDDMDRTKAKDNVRNALRNFPDVKLLIGIWSYNAPAIVQVVEETGKRKELKIVTFDAEKMAIDQMGDGMIDAMVVQNPYEIGYQCTRLLKALVQDDKATVAEMFPHPETDEGDLYDTGLKIVVPGADSPLKADMFAPKTEFFELPAFRQWLADHHLESS
ncbi:MAG TPA: substrate-binding domain-containing protein [Pirellulales bacterium]|nr:substrate-binding domain-containing protein [Pirellulales bacterium]